MPWNWHMSCVQHTWNRHVIYTRAHIVLYVIVVSLFSSPVPATYKVTKSTTLSCTYALTSIIIFIVACSVISIVDNWMLPWLSLVLCKFWFTHEVLYFAHKTLSGNHACPWSCNWVILYFVSSFWFLVLAECTELINYCNSLKERALCDL